MASFGCSQNATYLNVNGNQSIQNGNVYYLNANNPMFADIRGSFNNRPTNVRANQGAMPDLQNVVADALNQVQEALKQAARAQAQANSSRSTASPPPRTSPESTVTSLSSCPTIDMTDSSPPATAPSSRTSPESTTAPESPTSVVKNHPPPDQTADDELQKAAKDSSNTVINESSSSSEVSNGQPEVENRTAEELRDSQSRPATPLQDAQVSSAAPVVSSTPTPVIHDSSLSLASTFTTVRDVTACVPTASPLSKTGLKNIFGWSRHNNKTSQSKTSDIHQ